MPAFVAPYAPPDEGIAAAPAGGGSRGEAAEARIDARARRLVEAIRARAGGLGGIEDFLHAYSLSTKEGLALMVLAEALLRVPDAATADALIEDKLAAGDWSAGRRHPAPCWSRPRPGRSGVTARVIHPGETPETIVDSLVKRLGLPTVRLATRQAMRLLGSHFVLGQTIDEALSRAGSHREFRYSFDMLGEGARTAADAERYFAAYAAAIEAIGAPRRQCRAAGAAGHFGQALGAASALRGGVARRACWRAWPAGARSGAGGQGATISTSPSMPRRPTGSNCRSKSSAACWPIRSLAGWDGFGLAVQAYQKRAPAVIDWLAETAQRARPPADGAAGQGRLLGHRDQARAGARPCRTIRCSPARP